jgi:hypothetical protein
MLKVYSAMSWPLVGLLALATFAGTGCQKANERSAGLETASSNPTEAYVEDDLEFLTSASTRPFSCQSATAQEIQIINQGNARLNDFLGKCYAQTQNSHWCDQLVRPNPASHPTFDCTYGAAQPHYLIHPDEGTWINAFKAVQLVQELENKGLKVCLIYNWWRPEPYNKNVAGAAGRHPYGTAVDVRFCSDTDAIRGFEMLCQLRKQGRIRAIGYYGGAALHFGIGDRVANTWGKSCQ